MNTQRCILLLAVTASATWDFFFLKIPNKLLLVTAIAGTAFCLLNSSSVTSLISYVGRAALIILILEPLSKMRMIGAGDVKLFSVMCAYLGIKRFVSCFILTLLFAGAVSIFKLVRSGRMLKQIFNVGKFIVGTTGLRKTFSYEYDRELIIPLSVCTLCGYVTFLIFL